MEEKKIELSMLFAKYGLTDETLKKSKELDPIIVKEQRERLENWKKKIA